MTNLPLPAQVNYHTETTTRWVAVMEACGRKFVCRGETVDEARRMLEGVYLDWCRRKIERDTERTKHEA